LVQKYSRIKVYNALALPILIYGSEVWSLRQKDKNRLTSIEMKFCRRTAGCTLVDQKRNEENLDEFKAEPVDEKQDAKSNAEL
jgi:hypothetical protein